MALAPKKIAEELSSSLQVLKDDLVLPSIPYDREVLDEIIEELKMRSEVKDRLSEYLEYIEQQVSELKTYQAKRYPENFYQEMRTVVLEIRNTAIAIHDLTKPYHQTLPNTLKELILKWITPLEAELEKRIEMPASNRDELDLKTKHLCAEQSFISRQESSQQTLMQHLGRLKELLLVSGHPAPRCYISYAWPSEQHKAQEYWVQPFLFVLYDHLKAAGIRVVMDIRDNNPGDSIYQFMKQYHQGNYIILIGTESLLEKHYGKRAHAVQTELSIINNRFEQDQNQFGQSRIYPMLISGTIKSAYPEIYDKYHTVRDARDAGYVGTLKKLIDWIYETSVKQKASGHSSLWQSFYNQSLELSKESSTVAKELSLGYHGQRLEFLRQDIQYQAVQAQEQTQHSQAVQAEQIAALMKSQGSNPQLFYDANGVQFQRPYTNPDFIMRQGLWDKMTSHFAQSDQQILTLTAHGLGGMGKTELAQYYYQHPPRPYTLRAWFYAETKDNLYQQYVDLAAEHPEGMKFPKETPIEEKVKQIKKWLEKQKDCLLIYDNVPDAKEIEALLPTMGKHHILITSRNAIDWPVHQILDVDVMEEKEAIALICKITGYREDDSSIKQLVETLGYLPLALAQAGAYIAAKSLSIKDYLNIYEDYQPKLLTERSARSPKHEPIWITFDINFDALGNDCPAALETLKRASWLASSAIPEVLLSLMLKDDIKDRILAWNNIKEQIKRYSLMRINVEEKQLSIHPLIQDILRNKQDETEKIRIFKEMCVYTEVLFRLYKKDNFLCRGLLSHAESLHKHTYNIAQIAKSHKEESELFLLEPACLKHLYLYFRLDFKALRFLTQEGKILENYYGKDHIKIADNLYKLGIVYKNLGKPLEAKSSCEQALRIQEAYYGKDHIGTAETLRNLGNVYGALGKSLEAKSYYECALRIQEAHYGKDHIETAGTLGNLGIVYEALGKPLKARSYYKCALRIQESHYGKDHIEKAGTLHNLGAVYRSLGKPLKACSYYEQALRVKESHYGKEHIATAFTLNNLGNVYSDLRKPVEACSYFERALRIKESHYGKDHVETVNTLGGLGNVCRDLRKSSEAFSYYERVLRIQESYYGKNHIKIAFTLYNLGRLYLTLNQCKYAIQCLLRSKAIYRENFSEDHSNFLEVERLLKEAELALSNIENQFSEKKPNTEQLNVDDTLRLKALSLKLNKQGVYYFQAKEYVNALTYFERALKLQEKISDVPNEEIATLHFNMGSIYFFQNDCQSAIAMLQTAYGLHRDLLGDSHAATEEAKTRLEECSEALMNVTLDEIMLEAEHVNSARTRTLPLVFSVDATVMQNETQEQAKVQENLSWHYQH